MERPEITVVNHYDIFPYNHGGIQVIMGLYKGLSEWFDINIVTFTPDDNYASVVALSDHIKVFPIVLPEKLKEMQDEVCKRFPTHPDPAPAVMMYYHKFQEIIDRVRFISMRSSVVIAEHAYTWKIIKTACADKHFWYRAQNVEYDYQRQVKGPDWMPKDLQQVVYEVEKECCEKSERILTISEKDKNRFIELYKMDRESEKKIVCIGAGFDPDSVTPVFPKERKNDDAEYEYTGLFIATGNKETNVAANKCVRIAENFPNIQIIIAGDVGTTLSKASLPSNVLVHGIIPEELKNSYLKQCDFAMNLVESGAGINVKMFEWFAYGIPVIASKHGTRGIDVTNGKDCIVSDVDGHDELDAVEKFCSLSIDEKDTMARNARELLVNRYAWRKIAKSLAEIIREEYHIDFSEYALPFDQIAFYRQVDLLKPANEPEWIRSTNEVKSYSVGVGSDDLIKKLCNPNYSFELGEDIYGRFRFPFEAVKAGSKIVIYGAGVVGKTFLQQIARSSYCTVRAVCDQNPGKAHILEAPVISLATLSGMPEAEYDYIIIAIEKRNVAMEIHQNLIFAGISPKKIRWINPDKSCASLFVSRNEGGWKRQKVTREDIIKCYHEILGREPENEAVIKDYMERGMSLDDLRNEFMNSEEFKFRK